MSTASLELRIQALEDEREINKTLHQYGHTIDYGPEEDFLDVFADDCLFHTAPPPREKPPGMEDVRRFEGKGAMGEFFRHHTRAPEYYTKHLAVQPRIKVTGDDAEVISYLICFDEHPDGPYIRVLGRYHDKFVRCSDGRWRIKERWSHPELFHLENIKYRATPWVGMPATIS